MTRRSWLALREVVISDSALDADSIRVHGVAVAMQQIETATSKCQFRWADEEFLGIEVHFSDLYTNDLPATSVERWPYTD